MFFSLSLFSQFEWLEYSNLKKNVFCYACRNFGTSTSEVTFTTKRFKNWKKSSANICKVYLFSPLLITIKFKFTVYQHLLYINKFVSLSSIKTMFAIYLPPITVHCICIIPMSMLLNNFFLILLPNQL